MDILYIHKRLRCARVKQPIRFIIHNNIIYVYYIERRLLMKVFPTHKENVLKLYL